jgi:hypothetical protein
VQHPTEYSSGHNDEKNGESSEERKKKKTHTRKKKKKKKAVINVVPFGKKKTCVKQKDGTRLCPVVACLQYCTVRSTKKKKKK